MPRIPRFALRAVRGACLSALVLLARPAAADTAPTGLPHPAQVRVTLDERVTIPSLQEAGLDVLSPRGHSATVFAWPEDLARLRALGAEFTMVDPDPGASAAARARLELDARATPARSPVRSAVRADGRYRIEMLPPFGSGSMGGYWTLDEVKMKLDSLVANDANDVVEDQVDTIGTTVQGRPIWALRLGKHVTGPDTRPVAYFNSLIHCREPIGMQSLFHFVDDLLAGYGTDPWKTYLLDRRRIVICPVANPDGYQANVNTYISSGGTTFGMWRKNARDNNSNGSFDSGDGVDLNRNFSYQWGFDNIGSSGTPTSETYRGPSAFSEPESRAQRDEIAALAPATACAFHTYGDLWLHPWGYQVTATADSALFYEWNDEAMAGVNLSAGQSTRVLYSVNGEFNDWCYGETGLKPRLYSWTPEVGTDADGFWPPPSRILPLSEQSLRECYTVAAIAGPCVRAERADWAGDALVIGAAGSVEVRARNIGRAPTGTGLRATLVSLDAGAQVLSGPVDYPTLAPMTSAAPNGGTDFQISTADTLTPGRLLRFRVEFQDDDGLFCRDTVEIPAGVPTVLVNDPGNDVSGWVVTGAWGVVSNQASHPSRYFTDSPAGKYTANLNSPFVRRGSFDFSGVLHAWADFEARWQLEGDYDGCLAEASLDSVTWTALAGTATTPGTLTASLAGKPLYEGFRYNWAPERVDLSSFCGPTATQVRFRFRTVSDSGVQFDGMSFDSLRIAIYDPAAQPAPVAVAEPAPRTLALAPASPNPARGGTAFAWTLPVAGRARLEILDLAGRRVATVAEGDFAARRYTMRWDLRGANGSAVAPGIYFARLVRGAEFRQQRFVVLR